MTRRLVARQVAQLALLTTVVPLFGCEGGRAVSGALPPHGLTVRVRITADLMLAARALGWPGAGVPSAVVVAEVASADSGQRRADSAMTDASGIARFRDLRAGRYTLRVSRLLLPAEQTRAGAALGNFDGLAGVGTIAISAADADTVDVELRGIGGSSLLFSEIYGTEPLLGNGGVYYYGGYLEIYNNADTTVQLGGKLLFEALPGNVQSSLYGCTTFAAIQNDPAGLWAGWVFRFPASSRPLKPGEAAVIATDAIDHRQIKNAPGFFDLSLADFEFKGSKDAHNPLAQGMLDVGPRPFIADGHGWRTGGGRTVLGLAESLDLNALPVHYDPIVGGGTSQVRIPREALLDVVQWKPINVSVSPYVDCPSSVVTEIDAAEARSVVSFTDTLAMHRRVSRSSPTGRVILQRSRNSAADWYADPGTPGKVP